MNNQQRRRRPRSVSSIASTSKSIATTALAVYGTYKLASWAWNTFTSSKQQGDENHNDQLIGEEEQEHHQRQQRENIVNSTTNGKKFTRLSNTQLQAHLRKCQQETRTTFTSFLPTLLSKIESSTKLSQYTKALKKLRLRTQKQQQQIIQDQNNNNGNEEARLWKQIQVVTMTRMISTIYAHAIFYLVLHVQIHILAGAIVRQKQHEQQREGISSSSSVQDDLLSSSQKRVLKDTVQNFLSRGLPALIQKIEQTILDCHAEWKEDISKRNIWNVVISKQDDDGKRTEKINNDDVSSSSLGKITKQDMEDALTQICNKVDVALATSSNDVKGNENKSDDDESSFLISLFANNDEEDKRTVYKTENSSNDSHKDTMDDPMAQQLWDESWDLLDSPTYEEAQRQLILKSLSILQNGSSGFWNSNSIGGWKEIFIPSQEKSNNDDNEIYAVPLVNVLTRLKKITSDSFSTKIEREISSSSSSWWKMGEEGEGIDSNDEMPNVHLQAFEDLSSLKELAVSCFYSY